MKTVSLHIHFLCSQNEPLEARALPSAQPAEVIKACWGKPHSPVGGKTTLARRRGEKGVTGDFGECDGRGKHRCVKERRKREIREWQCVDARLV